MTQQHDKAQSPEFWGLPEGYTVETYRDHHNLYSVSPRSFITMRSTKFKPVTVRSHFRKLASQHAGGVSRDQRRKEEYDFCAGVEGADGKGLPPRGLREILEALAAIGRQTYIDEWFGIDSMVCLICGGAAGEHLKECAIPMVNAILARYTPTLPELPETTPDAEALQRATKWLLDRTLSPEPQEPVCSECGGSGWVSHIAVVGPGYGEPGTPEYVDEPCPNGCTVPQNTGTEPSTPEVTS